MTTLTYALHGREIADLSVGRSYRRLIYLIMKRLLDLIIATILMCAVSPLIFLAVILIRLESKGSAIFVQERMGARYRWEGDRIVWKLCLFRCYKLRTMWSDADQSIHKDYLRRFRKGCTEAGHASAPFKLNRDSRITRIGQLLRRTSLDELPQLWNVVKGEMSLVGPRPVPTYEVELYDDSHYARLASRPGITGIWQVYGRSRVTFEEMVKMDIDYVQRSSILFDIKLLLLTITSVVSLKGAA